MDQVKQYLGIAKKYHFWILAVVVIATGVGVWMKAASALAARYEQDKNTITTAEKGVQGASSPDNPNPQFTKKVEGLHDGLKKQVFDAWEKLYARQVALFTWPELELKPTVDLNRLRPDEEIPEYVRVFYNERVIQPMWSDLLEEVKIRQPKKKDESDEEADDSPRGPNQNRAVEYEGLVVWKPEKRQAIISRYLTENGVPSSAKVRLIQEDYWLFESLIKVINTVNEGATDSLKAPIKEIDTLDVAQWAVAASLESGATIWTKSQAAAGTTGGGMSGMAGMGGSAGMTNPMGMTGPPTAAGGAPPAAAGGAPPAAAAGGAGAGGAKGGAAANDADWFEGRFLDEKGQPLKGTTHPFAEFRQMFVFMKLIMDQRRIPDLVAACANADLPIETRQVRVQLLQRDAAAGGGLFGDGGGFGGQGAMPSFGAMGGGAMGGAPMGGSVQPSTMGGGPMGGSVQPSMMGGMDLGGGLGGLSSTPEGGVETTVFDVVVELSGVIYLYNPPDMAKLGTGAASSPEKRSFGVPTSAVKLPVAAGAAAGGFGNMGGGMPMGSGMTPGGGMAPNPMGR